MQTLFCCYIFISYKYQLTIHEFYSNVRPLKLMIYLATIYMYQLVSIIWIKYFLKFLSLKYSNYVENTLTIFQYFLIYFSKKSS